MLKSVRNVSFLIGLFALGCATATSGSRVLSADEMRRYNLNGILRDAKICPNMFDEKMQRLQVSGPCEIVDCVEADHRIVCTATAKSP